MQNTVGVASQYVKSGQHLLLVGAMLKGSQLLVSCSL